MTKAEIFKAQLKQYQTLRAEQGKSVKRTALTEITVKQWITNFKFN